MTRKFVKIRTAILRTTVNACEFLLVPTKSKLTPPAGDTNPVEHEKKVVKLLWTEFANRNAEVVAYVAVRTFALVDDRAAQIWSRWVLTRLSLSHAFRDRLAHLIDYRAALDVF